MRFLVTGSGGYLGSRLLKRLRRGSPGDVVIGAARRYRRPGERSCRFGSVRSVRRLFAAAKPQVIFHCVGTTQSGPWEKLTLAHLVPTLNLLEAVRLGPAPRPRVVVIGSAAEYGSGKRGRRFTENSVSRPETLYGLSKHLQTTLAMAYGSLGIQVIVARLFNLLAPDAPTHFAVSRVLWLLQKRRKGSTLTVQIGPRQSIRDYLPLDKALSAIEILGRRGRPGEIYNVCSGRGTRMGELFNALADGAGVRVHWVPAEMGSKKSAATYCVGDPGKIRRHTGWSSKRDILETARDLARPPSPKGRRFAGPDRRG